MGVMSSLSFPLKLLFWILILLLFRKAYLGYTAKHFVDSCYSYLSEDAFLNDERFLEINRDFKEKNQTPLVLFLNRHVLNMANNWLCNTKHMEGIHERTVMVTLDNQAKKDLETRWPGVRQLYWPTPCLQGVISWASGAWQAILIQRCEMAAAFATLGTNVWMLQHDTIWKGPEFMAEFERNSSDIVFDQNGFEAGERRGWINGGNFFMRATPRSRDFFKYAGYYMNNFYTIDVAVWQWLCFDTDVASCQFLDFDVSSTWEWLHVGNRSKPPYLLGLDAESAGTKFNNLAKYGFQFLNSDGSCNSDKVKQAIDAIENGKVPTATGEESLTRYNFLFYMAAEEILLKLPYLGENIVKPYISLAGHYLMITL